MSKKISAFYSLILVACLTFYFVFFGIFTQNTGWVEMLVYPYLLNNGFLLYKDLVAPYTPLLIWFLQGYEGLLGYNPQVLQGLAIFLGWLNSILIFLVVKKLWKNESAAILGAIFYAMWFFYFDGNGVWFELVQTPFIIASFYFLYNYFFNQKTRFNLVVGVTALVITFFIKQSGIYFIAAFLLWLSFSNKFNFKKIAPALGIFVIVFGAVFLVTVLAALVGGYAPDYFKWAFEFAFINFPQSSGHKLAPTGSQIAKLLMPIFFAFPLFISVHKRDNKAWFCILFLAVSFMSVIPRWGLFHLQPFLALLAICSPIYFLEWMKKEGTVGKVVLIGLIFIWLIVAGRQLGRFWDKPIRFFEPDVYQLSDSIKQNNLDINETFIFNAPDQLYLLTGTVPTVKPYIQNFSWQMEQPGVQESVIAGLQSAQPKYIIFSPQSPSSGLKIGEYRPEKLYNYVMQNYILKNKINDNVWILETR